MADQAAKERRGRRPAVKAAAEGSPGGVAVELALSPLQATEGVKRRGTKRQEKQKLEEFRASFSRGYAVILMELRKRRAQAGEREKS